MVWFTCAYRAIAHLRRPEAREVSREKQPLVHYTSKLDQNCLPTGSFNVQIMSDEEQYKSSSLQYIPRMEQNRNPASFLQFTRIDCGYKVSSSDEYLYRRHGRDMSQLPLQARGYWVTARAPWRFDNNTMLLTGATKSQRIRKANFIEGDRRDENRQSSRIAKRMMPQRPEGHPGKRIKKSRVGSDVHQYPIFRSRTSMSQQQSKDVPIIEDLRVWRLPEEGTGHTAHIETSSSRVSDDPFSWILERHKEVSGGGGGGGKPTSTTGSQGVSLYATAGPSPGSPHSLIY